MKIIGFFLIVLSLTFLNVNLFFVIKNIQNFSHKINKISIALSASNNTFGNVGTNLSELNIKLSKLIDR